MQLTIGFWLIPQHASSKKQLKGLIKLGLTFPICFSLLLNSVRILPSSDRRVAGVGKLPTDLTRGIFMIWIQSPCMPLVPLPSVPNFCEVICVSIYTANFII